MSDVERLLQTPATAATAAAPAAPAAASSPPPPPPALAAGLSTAAGCGSAKRPAVQRSNDDCDEPPPPTPSSEAEKSRRRALRRAQLEAWRRREQRAAREQRSARRLGAAEMSQPGRPRLRVRLQAEPAAVWSYGAEVVLVDEDEEAEGEQEAEVQLMRVDDKSVDGEPGGAAGGPATATTTTRNTVAIDPAGGADDAAGGSARDDPTNTAPDADPSQHACQTPCGASAVDALVATPSPQLAASPEEDMLHSAAEPLETTERCGADAGDSRYNPHPTPWRFEQPMAHTWRSLPRLPALNIAGGSSQEDDR